MGVLLLLSRFLMVWYGFVYTICSEYLCFLPLILHHFASRLATKVTAFFSKIAFGYHQNALHLAPKRHTFSSKMHYI